MTFSLNTYRPLVRKSILSDFKPTWSYICLVDKEDVESVVINFPMSFELVSDFNDNELTLLSMESSENSFAELWNLEDDDYWSSYLDK